MPRVPGHRITACFTSYYLRQKNQQVWARLPPSSLVLFPILIFTVNFDQALCRHVTDLSLKIFNCFWNRNMMHLSQEIDLIGRNRRDAMISSFLHSEQIFWLMFMLKKQLLNGCLLRDTYPIPILQKQWRRWNAPFYGINRYERRPPCYK